MNKRQQLGAQSREKILDAAERLFAQRGYTGMTTSQLSKESGLPAASLYWHFGNKIGVLAAVLNRRADSVFEELLAYEADPDDPFDTLNQLVQRSVAGVAKYPEFYRLIAFLSMETSADTEQIAPTIQGIQDRAVNTWHNVLTRVLEPSTPAEHAAAWDLAELARAMYMGGVLLAPMQGQMPFNRAIRGYVDLLHGALEQSKSLRSG